MSLFSLLSILFALIRLLGGQQSTLYESEIKNQIFNLSNYDNTIRPADMTQLSLKLTTRQITALNEQTQTLTTSSYLFVSWTDSRLKWNSTLYGNVYLLGIPASFIWLPDLSVINTADSNGFLSYDKYIANLFSNGLVYMNIGLIDLNTRCEINIYKFPYDEQKCSIQIGSWFQPSSIICIISDTQFNSIPDLFGYISNPIWSVKSTNVSVMNVGLRFLNLLTATDFFFNLTLQREPSYYIYNTVYPSLILNCVTLIAFFISFELQASLSLTSFVSQSVIALNVANEIPVQSRVLPLISLFFILSLFYSFVSFSWFTLAEYLREKKFKIKNTKIIASLLFIQADAFSEQSSQELKDQLKNEHKMNVTLLNKVAFSFMLTVMLTSYMAIWIIISN